MTRQYFKKVPSTPGGGMVTAHVDAGDIGTDVPLGGYVLHEASIVFFDLVNFTNISWSLTTAQVLEIVQPLFERASLELFNAGGMVDKYPGDGVVGFIPKSSHGGYVDSALDCATRVMWWFYRVHRPKFTLPKPSHTLELCVGVDAGLTAVAHVGSKVHSELILLGHQVNCASKCQAAADKKEVVVGQDARDRLVYPHAYGSLMSTGPATGIVYTSDNRPYKSYRFDWEKAWDEYSWIRT